MKSIVFIIASCLFIPLFSYSQCTPNAPTGNPGVTPPPDSIPCIERGVPYDFTMQTENYDTFTASILGQSINVLINFTRIDSIKNLPCGISWQADTTQFGPGETGCIRVSGTTSELVGQYPLKIYMTMNLTVAGNTFERGGEVTDLLEQLQGFTGQQLPVDLAYVSRVIQPGGNCPARDTSSTGVSSGTVCPPLSVTIAGVTSICAGASTTLTATPQFDTGTVTYSWSTGATTAAITASATGPYSVTVNDQNGSATASTNVTTGTAPTASFTATATGAVATVVNATTNASTYAWNFGDGSTSTLQSPPNHTYTSNGTKTITLIATNSCGSDTATNTVTIVGVGINTVQYDLLFAVYPNPSNGQVALDFSADNSTKGYDLNILDLSGKTVYAEKIAGVSGSVQKSLDLSALPKGVYTLRLSSEKGFGMKKLMLN